MKFIKLLTASLVALSLHAADKDHTIVVGVSPVPHAEILEFVKPKLKEKGYDLVISEISDYSIPNVATEDGSLDANFFQHLPYLEEQNKARGLHLISVAGVHVEPLGFYSKKIKDIKELKDGAKVAIAYDPSNGNRALRILEKAGLIEIDKGVKTASVNDITKNSKISACGTGETPTVIVWSLSAASRLRATKDAVKSLINFIVFPFLFGLSDAKKVKASTSLI